MDFKTLTKLIREIAKTKEKLILKAEKKWLYENFWQIEVYKLRDKYRTRFDYSENWKVVTAVIDWLYERAMNYTHIK